QAECLAAQFAERQTAGAVKQDVAESIAGPAAHGAKPRVREFPGSKGIFSAGSLDVAFDTEHPRTGLPVVAALDAAGETRRLGRTVVDGAPGIAEIGAEIGTGPAIDIERLIDGVGGARSIRKVGRLRRHRPTCSDHRHRAQNQSVHLTLPTPLP